MLRIASSLTLACLALTATAAAARELHVGTGQIYPTIQAAVNASAPGDVILVHDGTYLENVVVWRRVTLRSLDYAMHGENDGAVIDASAAPAPGILVSAAAAVVEGFSVFGATGADPEGWPAGIAVVGAAGCRLAGNRCGLSWSQRNDLGIALRGADDAVVVGNEVAFGIHGIWIEDSARGEIRGNDIHGHIVEPGSSGLRLLGQSVKDASTTDGTLLVGNHVHDNNVGAYVVTTAPHTTITANTFENNYVGVLVGEGCPYTVVAGNAVRGNTGRGIHLNGAHHAAIVGNVVEDNEVGIWLGFTPPVDEGSDHGLVFLNAVTGNAAAGLRISAEAEDNRICLNHFAANQPNVEAVAGAAWLTSAALSTFHDGTNDAAQLGNLYDTYAGEDLDGDGIGDTDLPFTDGDPVHGPQETAPLVGTLASFDLQVWFLGAGAPPIMRRGDATQPIRETAIPAGGATMWVSATAAGEDLTFAAGAWSGWLRWAVVPAPGTVVAEVGTTRDGSEFTPSGAQVVLGDPAWDIVFTTSVAPITVLAGRHLAFRVVNGGSVACALRTGGGMSAVSSPGLDDPCWPAAVTSAPDAAPAAPVLRASRPNPFNPRTEIAFDLPATGRATLRIYDPAGRLVCTLLDADLPAGPGAVTWDGRDAAGRAVAAGAYLYRLTFAGGAPPLTRRMLLVR